MVPVCTAETPVDARNKTPPILDAYGGDPPPYTVCFSGATVTPEQHVNLSSGRSTSLVQPPSPAPTRGRLDNFPRGGSGLLGWGRLTGLSHGGKARTVKERSGPLCERLHAPAKVLTAIRFDLPCVILLSPRAIVQPWSSVIRVAMRITPCSACSKQPPWAC
jgi:hypothetical protein